MLSKEECQTLIVAKILQARWEMKPYILNRLSGQIRGLVSVVSEQPTPFNDYLPDLLDLAEIPYEENPQNGDLIFPEEWLIERGFDLSNIANPIHPKFNQDW